MGVRAGRRNSDSASPRRRSIRAAIAAVASSLIRRVSGAVCYCVPRRDRGRRRFLRLTSTLPGACVKLAAPCGESGKRKTSPDRWHGHCPCCKRPVELSLAEAWRYTSPAPGARGKFAYVINLWGSSPEYVLGAMVLGQSLKKTGSLHRRVCLYASDVPEGFIPLLSHLWDCRLVEHVRVAAAGRLSDVDPDHRFAKVFTKLRALSLVEFEKVLVMDIDLIVLSSIDELFDLPTPAAMRRGMNDSWYRLQHGDSIDGSKFFMGADPSKWSWGQGTGINAGVMLWQPDLRVLDEMLSELSEPNHPEHCVGNGPEQDYLSRYWADAPWTHIGVGYNYQVHQMFLALHPDKVGVAERVDMLRVPEQIKVVHFSGEDTAKPWRRVLDTSLAEYWPHRSRDHDYVHMFAEEFEGYYLWVKQDREWLQGSQAMSSHAWTLADFFVGDDGRFYRRPSDEFAEAMCVELPDETVRSVLDFLGRSLGAWFDTFQELEGELGFDIRCALVDALTEAPSSLHQPVSGGDVDVGGSSLLEQHVPMQFHWQRQSGSWWSEVACPDTTRHSGLDAANAQGHFWKVTATCGTTTKGRFVLFLEDCVETYEQKGAELCGLFAKVVGVSHKACCFPMPVSTDKSLVADELASALVPVRSWVDVVLPGAVVLLALVGLELAVLELVLLALAPLGVPTVPPAGPCCSFAAVGMRPNIESGGNEQHQSRWTWYTTHASSDVAYASMPLQEGLVVL